jgi:putative ATP-dependent endonuclease of OLD family
MYLARLSIANFRCFGATPVSVELNEGLTALVGENDAGKTAVIDALRYALGTTDQDWLRIEDDDFHSDGATTASSITIHCEFRELNSAELSAFVEHLTYGRTPHDPPALHVHWTVKSAGKDIQGRTYRRAELHSGPSGEGPVIPHEVRELLQATYLRPLRDAEQALAAGRGSRSARIVSLDPGVSTNTTKVGDITNHTQRDQVGVAGIAALIDELLHNQKDLKEVTRRLDDHLGKLSVQPAKHKSTSFKVSNPTKPDLQLRALLEKLDLETDGSGPPGLGTNNALFMACELLQLNKATEGLRLLLIEEPEAHLHAQRQLRVMQYLQEHSRGGLQVIVTTHSPNLASVIKLDNIVMVEGGLARSLSRGKTKLDASDYEFLERFLDATKANLFFARGVLILLCHKA